MYLILAAQFESWTQPVSILMALPVTIPFGLLSLVLFRTPMDLYAMFGLFMLVGIVKKNGILQVDATNQLRAEGMPRHEAIVEANHTRLRPILMTTVMLVAAMVPIALGQGPGAGARASMAKVIIGGQMLSLVLALLVTPVFYALLDMLGQPHPPDRHPLLGRAGLAPPDAAAHRSARVGRELPLNGLSAPSGLHGGAWNSPRRASFSAGGGTPFAALARRAIDHGPFHAAAFGMVRTPSEQESGPWQVFPRTGRPRIIHRSRGGRPASGSRWVPRRIPGGSGRTTRIISWSPSSRSRCGS